MNEHIKHDKFRAYLHYSVCKKLGIQTAENWYAHIPSAVYEHKNITTMQSRCTYR